MTPRCNACPCNPGEDCRAYPALCDRMEREPARWAQVWLSVQYPTLPRDEPAAIAGQQIPLALGKPCGGC